jgi:P-type Ca2+ transporter type 2C
MGLALAMTRTAGTSVDAPHARPTATVARLLHVAPDRGLTDAEAQARYAHFGPNELERQQPPSIWRTIVGTATEPFVLMLAAAGLGAVLLGEVRDGLFVLIGLLPIIGADVATTYRSERALAELRDAVAPRAHVLRDGQRVELPVQGIVPGDILLLGAGDVVPADARVLSGGGLLVDRSILTGESVPEQASAEPDPVDALLPDRRGMVYAGTSVVGGRGGAVVVATGTATELGSMASGLVRSDRRRSPLQRELDRLVRILLFVACGLIVVTVGLGFARGQPAGANLMAGISAAIAAIPEEPPILLAVVLGLGAYRLMRRGVFVRRLASQEALGAVDLIVTDKTGTLTQNRLVVEDLVRPGGSLADSEWPEILLEALTAEEEAWTPSTIRRQGSFTAAIVAALEQRGVVPEIAGSDLISAAAPGDRRPYSLLRHTHGGGWRELLLGAPEVVIDFAETLAGTDRDAWLKLVEAEAGRGGRLLMLAVRHDDGPWLPRVLIRFADPVREDVREAVAEARRAGIQTMMVTGDHRETALAIADAVGLPSGAAVTADALDAVSDEKLARMLRRIRLVARATPEHKLRLVRVGQASGRSVAVTGDGVNDATALQAADVAVAMGSGTAVARGASDLVLGDDSFATMMHGLREGRRIVDNVQKGLVFLVSTHVALLGFILVATLAGFGQPLVPLQILWLELFIDLSTSVAFEREPEEPGVMDHPPRPRGRPLLDNGILARIAAAGGFSSLAALGIMLLHPGPSEQARWMAFTTLVVAQAVRAYANRSITRPVSSLAMNGFLAIACVATVAIQAAIPFIPSVSEAFRAVPLSPAEWLVVVAIAVAPAALAEFVRAVRRGTVWIA